MSIINNIINNNTIINCTSTICNSISIKSVEMETMMLQWNFVPVAISEPRETNEVIPG